MCEASEGLKSVSVIYEWEEVTRRAESPPDGIWGDSVGPLDARDLPAVQGQMKSLLYFLNNQVITLMDSIHTMLEKSEGLRMEIEILREAKLLVKKNLVEVAKGDHCDEQDKPETD